MDRMDDDEKFLTKTDLVKGHIDSIVTVATAVLVLSVTLLKEAQITDSVDKSLLRASWVGFTIAIIAGIVHNFSLMRLVKRKDCWTDSTCGCHRGFNTIMVIVLHLAFISAVVFLLIFALLNVK